MDKIRMKYRIILISVFIIMGLVICFMYFYTTNKSLQTYQESAEKSIIDIKKIFLKDTVNNVILEIEKKQENRAMYYKYILNEVANTLDFYYEGVSSESFLDDAIKYLQNKDYANINIQITKKNSDELLYKNFDSAFGNITTDINETNYPVYLSRDYGKYIFTLFVKKEVIDEDVKTQMQDVIHSYKFSENAYIWVNEVINYNGGDKYAIRRIHPNLTDTEGMFLSTEMTDIAGNLRYLTELEGVKKNKEIFFNYYFQKKDSDIISEKITYAKLYEEYDWIIAMGIHLDDIDDYVKNTTGQSMQNVHEMLGITVLIMAFLIVFVLIFISCLEKWYYKNSNRELKEKAYLDSLTGLFNRRAGEIYLNDAFNRYKHTNQNSAIMMIDIDNFKPINDLCGHDKGDYVIIQIAKTLSRYIRSTDILCRWGGDEFVLICQGVKNDDIHPFANKLLCSVSDLAFECNENNIMSNVTISIGASDFSEDDLDSMGAVKRADKALYKAKTYGKNSAFIYDE